MSARSASARGPPRIVGETQRAKGTAFVSVYDGGKTTTLLVFLLEDREYAVRVALVRQIVRAVAVTSLPEAPEVIEGVVNWRGFVVPVLDIRSRFRLPPRPLHPGQHFIVARAGARTVALRVDRASGLVEVPESSVRSVREAAPGARHTEGIARLPDGLVVIHDLERFLSLDEGERVDAVLAARADSASPGDRP